MLRTIAKRCHHKDLIKKDCVKCIFYKVEDEIGRCTKFTNDWATYSNVLKPEYDYKCTNGKFFIENPKK